MYPISPQQHRRSVTVLATQFQTEHKLTASSLNIGVGFLDHFGSYILCDGKEMYTQVDISKYV